MRKHNILVIAGTRPEIIKLAPVIKAFQKQAHHFQTYFCLSGQHKDIVYPLLNLFNISPDFDLEVMREGQSLSQLTARLLISLEKVFNKVKPDIVMVQGDTTTAYVGALAAFYQKIPIAHVEAGLRTHQRYSPFPEEMNRAMISKLATYHFAPTEVALQNLRQENIPKHHILKSGNTTIDSLFWMLKNLDTNSPRIQAIQKKLTKTSYSKLVLATIHRRENQGSNLQKICAAFQQITREYPIKLILPIHPNPKVKHYIIDTLGGNPNIMLLPAQSYDTFVWLMSKADLIITDSGGIQEEAPSLGKPVIVLRSATERQEGLLSQCCQLAEINQKSIVNMAIQQLYHLEARPKAHLYGDGKAAERIVNYLKDHSRSMVNALFTTT